MDWLEWVVTVLYFLIYYPIIRPLYYLLSYTLTYACTICLTPLMAVGRTARCFALLPWRFLVKFEAILTFLGVALLIGAGTAVVQYLITEGIVHVVNKAFSQAGSTSTEVASASDSGSECSEPRNEGQRWLPPLKGRLFSTILEEEEEDDRPEKKQI